MLSARPFHLYRCGRGSSDMRGGVCCATFTSSFFRRKYNNYRTVKIHAAKFFREDPTTKQTDRQTAKQTDRRRLLYNLRDRGNNSTRTAQTSTNAIIVEMSIEMRLYWEFPWVPWVPWDSRGNRNR